MSFLASVSRFVLVRHGDTVGESSIRYHGKTDVVLSQSGRMQAERLREVLHPLACDCVVSSSLSRAWQTATILEPGAEIRIEEAFEEICFGRWEGLTRDEIAALDPELYSDWQSGKPGFEFPDGETRETFQSRVGSGLERLLTLPARSVLVVAHKGVVRGLAESLTQTQLPAAVPGLGEALTVQRSPAGGWHIQEDLSGR